MHKGLDIETQCRADAQYVLAIEFLKDGRLARVIQTTTHILSLVKGCKLFNGLQEQNAHFFFFLPVLPDDCKKTHEVLLR
jgi:hypothetical protein